MKEKVFTLYSQGCCGSTQMVECLKKIGLKRIAAPCKRNVHTRWPPRIYDNNVLWMYADPRNILLSAISRSKNNGWIHSHVTFLEGDSGYFDPFAKTSIEQILKDKYDPLRLKEHFVNWLETNLNYKLMMLKYESLGNPEIFWKVLDFFGVKNKYDYIWKPRKADYTKLPEEQRVQITELFADLLKIQAKISDCFIR